MMDPIVIYVVDLAESRKWSAWRKKIEKKFDHIITLIKRGNAVTQDEFDAVLGHIHGMEDAQEAEDHLLVTIHQMLVDAQSSQDPARLKAVIDLIDARREKAVAATLANTPADPSAGDGDTGGDDPGTGDAV